MIKSYIIIAIRNLFKFKIVSLINIFGLSAAIGCCLLSVLYVQHELTYDTFHKNIKRIYSISRKCIFKGGMEFHLGLPPQLRDELKNEFPELLYVTRFEDCGGVVSINQNLFNEELHFADSDFMQLFNFPLKSGNPTTALQQPYSVVITDEIAHKYFGDEDPMFRSISIKLGDHFADFTITGVAKSLPTNTAFKFNFLLPFENSKIRNSWLDDDNDTFVLLAENASSSEIEEQFHSLIPKYGMQNTKSIRLFSLTNSNFLDINIKGDVWPLYILSGIAFGVLLIACINFANLAIGRSFSRNKEVGLRKVIGASRMHIIGQLWGEALFTSLIALCVGVALAELFLPAFNSFIGIKLGFDYLSGATFGIFIGVLAYVVILSGAYPAFVLSKFNPIDVLKNTTKFKGPSIFINTLIVLQFSISIILIVGTIVMSSQLRFMKDKNLGFDREQLVAIPISNVDQNSDRAFHIYKNEVTGFSEIKNISGASSIPLFSGEHCVLVQHDNTNVGINSVKIDHDYLSTLGIDLSAGRNFSKELSTDVDASIIVNEEFVKAFGLISPIGNPFDYLNNPTIIGVLKDYHTQSLHESIAPMMLHLNPQHHIEWIIVRFASGKLFDGMELLQNKWRNLFPDYPFEYHFYDDRVDQLYRKEQKWNLLNRYVAALAIFIACIGIFGITSLSLAKRTKEIGIRKVLGASTTTIVYMLIKNFTQCVLLANVFAWPVAWFATNKWLQNFAFRINIDWWTFFLAGGMALGIALLTVAYQAIRAATANPVEALRYE